MTGNMNAHDEPTEDEWANMTMTELIARSSFGTPEAVALRARCPRWVVDEIMAGLRYD